MRDDEFCIEHGRDFMRSDKGPIPYCEACVDPRGPTEAEHRAFDLGFVAAGGTVQDIKNLKTTDTPVSRLARLREFLDGWQYENDTVTVAQVRRIVWPERQ